MDPHIRQKRPQPAVGPQHHDPRIGADEGRGHQRQDGQGRDHLPPPYLETRRQEGERHAQQQGAGHPAEAGDQTVENGRAVIPVAKYSAVVRQRETTVIAVDEAGHEYIRQWIQEKYGNDGERDQHDQRPDIELR